MTKPKHSKEQRNMKVLTNVQKMQALLTELYSLTSEINGCENVAEKLSEVQTVLTDDFSIDEESCKVIAFVEYTTK